jgi:hypothetical protein
MPETTMNRLHATLLAVTALAAFETTPGYAQAETEIPPEVMQMITGDISTIHMDVMQATIMLEPGQSGAFWTIYDEYLQGVAELTEQRTQLIRDYALQFDGMTTDAAGALGRRAIEVEERRLALLEQYFARIDDSLDGRVAAQFLQIENRIGTLKDLRLMMELPIIGG